MSSPATETHAAAKEGRAGLQVIGAGFGRTGTMSLKLALEQLGFGPCYHMAEVHQNPGHKAAWIRIEHSKRECGEGDKKQMRKVLQGYKSAVDWPVTHYWKELHDEFPEAKIILTVRDFDKWYNSIRSTIYGVTRQVLRKYALFPWMKFLQAGNYEWSREVFELAWGKTGDFKGQMENKEAARSIYEQRVAEVQASIPKDQLLVYRVSEGWEPLCRFLGVDVPSAPFPRVNSKEELLQRLTAYEPLDYLLIGLPIALAVGAGWALLQRSQGGV